MLEKIMSARCRLIIEHPFYGAVTSFAQWISKPGMPFAMGVTYKRSGGLTIYYNDIMCEPYTMEELISMIIHECEHVLRGHLIRYYNKMSKLQNIAADFAINGRFSDPNTAFRYGKKIFAPEMWCYVPEDWPGKETVEYYYERMMKENWCPICGMPHDKDTKEKGEFAERKDKKQEGGSVEPNKVRCPRCGREIIFSPNGHPWDESELTPEEIRQLTKAIVDRSKQIGKAPGHLTEDLEALNRPTSYWGRFVEFTGRYCGSTRKTYSRQNRRTQAFGTKGISHHAVAELGLVVDTSGSIGTEELQTFFGHIEHQLSKYKVWLLQWDHGFQKYDVRYRRGDWKNIKICGRGGTAMDKAQIWVQEKTKTKAVIFFTDGETAWLDNYEIPMLVVCSTNQKIPNYATKLPYK